ncbi:thiolase family protein [Actinokineospora guangxiensis]|uniref:Thiolase family protein n=1 Tax=Actinokineospora guangxiensis TaxID=1490288 RepID=A0ABW0EVW1_9PSEU
MTAQIYGTGTTWFGRSPDAEVADLAAQAAHDALADADVAGVDAVYVGTVFGEMGAAQRATHRLGLHGVPVVRVENACASATTALHEAAAAVSTGRYGRVLAIGVEHMSRMPKGPLAPEPRDPHGRAGLLLPSMYAMAATRYLERTGLTVGDLAAVAVKNRGNALLNRYAEFGATLTAEDVLSSRMISDPFTLHQCSPVSDGAAAAVVGPPRGRDRDVEIAGIALRSGAEWDDRSPHVWGFDIVVDTADAAYKQAGITPAEVQVVECHDAFTIGEVVAYETLGLAEPGKGYRLVRDGSTALGGDVVVNPSGGLLGRGHPLGATGLAQVHEVVLQLRGEAEDRQVADARVGVVETMGGGVTGIDGNACVVVVLRGRLP